jgi:hypothetical protein
MVLTHGTVRKPYFKILNNPEQLKYIGLVLGITVMREFNNILQLEY